jgi:hypothetical protein
MDLNLLSEVASQRRVELLANEDVNLLCDEDLDNHGSDHGNDEVEDVWVTVWDPSSALSMEEFMEGEPKHSINKKNTVNCGLVHNHESGLALVTHTMSSRLTVCRSRRCNYDDVVCETRYKTEICDKLPEVAVVKRQGDHTADLRIDGPPVSPREDTLPPVIREWIHKSLETYPTTKPYKLRDTIILKLRARSFPGVRRVPPLALVQNCVKTWRRQQPDFSRTVDSVEEKIADQVFDEETFHDRHIMAPVYLADTETVEVENPATGEIERFKELRLGNGEIGNPFRLGVTCRKLIEKYVTVQDDDGTTTIFHLDSTFGVVNTRYNFLRSGYQIVEVDITQLRILHVSADCGRRCMVFRSNERDNVGVWS